MLMRFYILCLKKISKPSIISSRSSMEQKKISISQSIVLPIERSQKLLENQHPVAYQSILSMINQAIIRILAPQLASYPNTKIFIHAYLRDNPPQIKNTMASCIKKWRSSIALFLSLVRQIGARVLLPKTMKHFL